MNHYVMCIDTGDYLTSLTLHKVYKVLPDVRAEHHGQIRVLDDSAEDYLFTAAWFVPVELSAQGQAALDKTAA